MLSLPINEGDAKNIPYATARRYHEEREEHAREPSIHYLVRVAETFGARLAWLTTGVEPMLEKEAEDQLWRSMEEEEGARWWKEAVELRDSVLKGWAHRGGFVAYPVTYMPTWVPMLSAVQQRLNVDTEQLGEALAAPLRPLGIDPAEMNRSGGEPLGSYIIAMTPVLAALAPEVEAQRPEEDESDG